MRLRIFFLIAFLTIDTCMIQAQDAAMDMAGLKKQLRELRRQRSDARVMRHALAEKENDVFLTIGTTMSAYNQMLGRFKLEYSRQIKGNMYWGVNASANIHALYSITTCYDCNPGYDCYASEVNDVQQNIYKLDGMFFYRLPVIRSRLFFRVGAGVGVAWHHMVDYRYVDLDEEREKVLPYLNFEAAWILRVAKGFEVKFQPLLIITPSEFSFSPVKLGAPTTVVPWLSDVGFSLTLGWRF